ncbi:hypothetical protein DFH09DRAFT_1137779 [Mycena vulgaris]|nr:hypothetical protein DFH09DRAFT_1137779 [Mycena vulgaris]
MPSPSTPRPSHRHSDSSPTVAFPRATDDYQKPASRLITSVRRTLSTAKRRDPGAPSAMYSTQAERNPERNPYTPTRFRYDTTRPTVEQIAMGLHLSRTPHLRGPPKYPAPASHPQLARPPIPLPPPPARSSLKKTVLAPSTSSTTDVASTAPSTPHSSDRSSASLRTRMARFLPHRAPPSVPSTASSPHTSSSELARPRKKAVRFSTMLEEED